MNITSEESPNTETQKTGRYIPLKSSSETQEKELKPPSRTTLIFLFSLSGLISIYPKYIMVAETDIMEKIYKDFDYSFYVLIPTYASIPPAFYLVKLFSAMKLRINTKINISLFLSCLFFTISPLVTLYFDKINLTIFQSYLLNLLGFYFCYVFCLVYQAYFTAILTLYDSGWTSFYFTFQALGYFVVVIQKGISFYFTFPFFYDFFFVWGFFFLFVLGSGIAFHILSKNEKFKHEYVNEEKKGILELIEVSSKDIRSIVKSKRRKLSKEEFEELRNTVKNKEKEQKIKYRKAWELVKSDAYGILISMTLFTVVFPGVFFSSPTPSLFGVQKYILIMNVIVSLFDVIFRPISAKKYAKALIKFSYLPMFLIAVISIYFFMTDFMMKFEGVVYLYFVFVAFLVGRTSISIGYYMINSGKKCKEGEQEAVGSIMTNILHVGIALGNLSSTLMLFVKKIWIIKEFN